MKPILIIKCGATIAGLIPDRGDFEDWIVSASNHDAALFVTINVEQNEALPPAEQFSGVVITGSHSMVTEQQPWSERTAAWLAACAGSLPLLGICYGHQLLGYALGGRVNDNPQGREMGSVDIDLLPAAADDPLFASLPAQFPAQVSHKQSLIDLPPQAVLLARSAREPHQAFRYGRCSWGVQFHPEFDAAISAAYVEYCRQPLLDEGQDPDELARHCRDSSSSALLLNSFVRLVMEQEKAAVA